MERELSLMSTASTNLTREASDSNSSSYSFQNNKSQRHGGSVPTSRFKGVVGQQNGHWGAQIYANHQRIWLGTFKSEKEAAMAYDSAAIKLRSGDSYRNFPWTNITVQEPSFQSKFSTDAVLNMIKDGSYPSKFAEFLKTHYQHGEIETSLSLAPVCANEGVRSWKLFQKELTPSDVGKLNRLVIPKKYALKYFFQISEDAKEKMNGGLGDVELVFFDRLMRSWKFRYCYWKSSQSFVFTRGWNRFVKEHKLKAKDMITFSMSLCNSGLNKGSLLNMIDISYVDVLARTSAVVGDVEQDDKMEEELLVSEGQSLDEGSEAVSLQLGAVRNQIDSEDEKEFVAVDRAKPVLRLFGVELN